MPWYLPSSIRTENVKKRICIYLIQRYLGQFLETKLTSDQLSVDLYNGQGSIEKVSLDMQALNEMGEKQNIPLEFVSGYVGKLLFTVPWAAPLTDSTMIEVHDLRITVQPKQRAESVTSMLESMWSSMTNSLQLAEECWKQDAEITDNSQPIECIEVFAKTIDSILSRVKVKFLNTSVHLEYLPFDSNNGVALIANIDSIQYTDEAGNDPPADEATNSSEQNKAYIVSSFTTKNFICEGVSLSTQEFSLPPHTASTRYSMDTDEDLLVSNVINESMDTPTESIQQKNAGNSENDYLDINYMANLITFAKIIGKQSIRVRLKTSEEVTGPKVSIEMTFGAVNVFLSPRQLYQLIEVNKGVLTVDPEERGKHDHKQKYVEKPMTGLDYQRVEQELQFQLNPAIISAPGLQGQHGWSTGQQEESDTDDNFYPLGNRGPSRAGMADSTFSTTSSSMESSLSSSMASTLSEATSNRTRRRFNHIESDPTAEISHFHIRLASFAIFLLHEDILTLSNEQSTSRLIPSSIKQMQAVAEQFFSTVSHLVPAGYGPRHFDDYKAVFEQACTRRHLRLIAAPVQIECHETTTQTAFSITGELTSAKVEVLECLPKSDHVEYVKILHFKDDGIQGAHVKPCLKMTFKHIDKTSKEGSFRRILSPKTELHFTLDSCILDIDITLMDRICALFNSPEVIQRNPRNRWTNKLEVDANMDSVLDIKVASHAMTLKLRIPVPDFRPPNDLQRVPWWDRNIRGAFLSANTLSILGHTTFQSSQIHQCYNIQCRALDLFYHESESATPEHIGHAGMDERLSAGCPTVTIRISPEGKQAELALEDPENVMSVSCGTILPSPRVGPFSSKRLIHESDTPHKKTSHRPADYDNEELVLPGSCDEMGDFIEKTTQSTRIHLDMSFPTASVQFANKHLFEVLYNHICSDLILWEPSAPVSRYKEPTAVPPPMFESFAERSASGAETFTSCRSGNRYQSESDDDSDDEFDTDNSNLFYSAYDIRHHKAAKKVQQCSQGQSYLTLNLRIGKGLIKINTPVRDVHTNVIPGQIGEFLLGLEEATLFTVSSYHGDENLGYVCIQSKGAQLHHSDMTSTTGLSNALKEFGSALEKHLFPTIYKSDPGMLAASKNRAGNREMLSVAVRIQANHETHHVKLVRVALGINKATLRHRMCPVPNIWITQLIDFFTVNDYAIPGFHPKEVLTEMHLHLWDCAIDYRPFHLPLRSVVSIGSFSMSSHLIAAANTTIMRFIAEECHLFLSDKGQPKKGIPSLANVDLRKDFVCVIDVGLVEISLKLNDVLSNINPHCDLRGLVNKFFIHTCADSAKALMELIKYIAMNGDLDDFAEAPQVAASPRHLSEQELIAVEPQDISNLSKSQHQQVNDMLGEAMMESVAVSHDDIPATLTGAKMFFFPDEGHALPETVAALPQVASELGDVTFRSNKSSDTDEEFCIIGDEAGIGIAPRNGLPQIRWLVDDPLRLVDNHFKIPFGKTDVLKPPKGFPMPVARYTLCEMSVEWKLYAGSDFSTAEPKHRKKSVNFSDLHDAIGYTNRNTGEIIFHHREKKKPDISWLQQGGVNRNHDSVLEIQLNKVRVQHELYPDHTTQASRQVIVISQFEIRDRLLSSSINKLLYQYSSEHRPKQTNAHMFTMKLVHIRPDVKLKAEECCLYINLLPLKINLDQDTLIFIINFASNYSGINPERTKDITGAHISKNTTPTHHPPVMTVQDRDLNKEFNEEEAQKLIDENLLLLLDDVKEKVANSCNESTEGVAYKADSPPIYFRKVIFSCAVPIRVDYHGKNNFDIGTYGPLGGLIMGMTHLNGSEFTLKRLLNNHGILGVDKLMNYFLQEWMNDIKRNQYHSVLSGVGPIHSLIQFFQGIRDLFWLPIEQYQKDGRIVKGLQRGANSFTTSTAMAALELTTRLINLIQITAETAYDMMSPGPSVRRVAKSKGRKKRYNQPQDFREGVTNAYNVVKEGFGEAAENIVRVASVEREQKGYSGAVGGVLRHIPPTFVKPIIIASKATTNVLGGMQCQLVPDVRREAKEKWKSDQEYDG